MILKPIEIRYLHEEKIIFIEYLNSKPKVRIPISYLYSYFIGNKINSKQYIVSIYETEQNLKIEFSDQKVISIIWEKLLEFANEFGKGNTLYGQK